MNEHQPSAKFDDNETGLPWPKSWKGAYIFAMASFVFWIVLLILLSRCS